MAEGKIARIYARALYEAAAEQGRVEEVRHDLGEFVAAVEASPELRQFLLSAGISDERKIEVLMELTESGDELMRNFLRLLVDKGRESQLVNIYRAFVHLVEEAQGLVRVEVTSAVPLPESLQEALRSKLGASLQKTVELVLKVDQNVLGGIRLGIGDKVVDATIRQRLERLRQSLVTPSGSLEGSVEAAS